MSKLMLIAIITLISIISAQTNALASPCDSIRCLSQVAQVYPSGDSDGKVWIMPKDGGQTNLSCTPESGVLLVLRKTNPSFKELYALLLSADLADATVNMRIIPNTNPCEIMYVTTVN